MALSLRELLETWHAAEADPVARARLDVLALARDALALGRRDIYLLGALLYLLYLGWGALP
mgnify:CR=1 FL=1